MNQQVISTTDSHYLLILSLLYDKNTYNREIAGNKESFTRK